MIELLMGAGMLLIAVGVGMMVSRDREVFEAGALLQGTGTLLFALGVAL